MRNNHRVCLRTLSIFVLLLFCAALTASAGAVTQDSNGMVTSRYDVAAVADLSHTFHITEDITVDFSTPHHGIIRYIPFDEEIYEIKNISVKEDPSDITWSSDEVEILIGDEDETITGVHQYRIEYEIVGFRDDSLEEDYLSLNLLPVEWDSPITDSTISLTMPSEIDWSGVAVYTGSYGSAAGMSGFTSSFQGNQAVLTGQNIPSRSGLTVSAVLPENYWSESMTYLEAHHTLTMWFLIITVFLGLLMMILWFLFGRDPHMVKPVEFSPPEGKTPLEIGYMIDGIADDADFMSMILYFASKGYLEIRETGKEDVFELAKVKSIDQSEPDYAVTLFNGLFGHGDTIKTSKIPAKYGPTIEAARKQLLAHFTGKDKRIYRTAGSVCRGIGYLCMAVLLFLPTLIIRSAGMAFFIEILFALVGLALLCSAYESRYSRKRSKTFLYSIFGGILVAFSVMIPILMLVERVPYWMLLLYLASGIVITLATTFMSAYTTQSAVMQGRILGFRSFIQVAEYDQLKRLSDENPQYFYGILPYAAVMGLQTKWAKKFTNIPLQAPDWYVYNGSFNYSTWWAMNMVNHCCVESAPVRGDFSGSGGGYSGGFSGGGFSGGGFGGGGGGGW